MCALARSHARSYRLHSLLGGRDGAPLWAAQQLHAGCEEASPRSILNTWKLAPITCRARRRILSPARRADGPTFRRQQEKGECLTLSHPSNATTVRLLNGAWVSRVCDCVSNFQRCGTTRSAVTWKKSQDLKISRKKLYDVGIFLNTGNFCENHFNAGKPNYLYWTVSVAFMDSM